MLFVSLGYSAYGACGIGEDSGAAMSGITADAIFNATGKWVLCIAMLLGRSLRWNPEKEAFLDDAEANALRSYPMRAPWSLEA